MPARLIDDATLRESIRVHGIAGSARHLGINERTIYRRIGKLNVQSPFAPGGLPRIRQTQTFPHRVPLEIRDGVVVVFGDAHYWPGDPPFMHRALVKMLKRFREERQLRAVIANGDMVDMAAISRYPRVNWEHRPKPKQEIEVCQDRLHEVAEAAGRVPKLWPDGNHDARFNLYIARGAPDLEGLKGSQLKDFFGAWQPCWSVLINDGISDYPTFVKHRMRGGIHAIRNNVKQTGTHIITNHLHAANVVAVTDMQKTLYGVDTGCIAEISSPQFLYTEDNPKDWREAFCVLRFKDGNLLPPQLVMRCQYDPQSVTYRDELIKI